MRTSSSLTLKPYKGLLTSVMACSLAAVVSTISTQAYADGNYRGGVAKFVGVAEEVVPCGVCHDSPGGGGPRNQLFYVSLLNHGLKPGTLESLDVALQGLEGGSIDSDNDSAPDLVELRGATNPNDASSKPASNDAGSGAGGGGNNPPPPPPPPPPPTGGSQGASGSNTGSGSGPGRAGNEGQSGSEPSSSSADSDEIDHGTTCSYGGASVARSQGAWLLAALSLLTAVRLRRRGGS